MISYSRFHQCALKQDEEQIILAQTYRRAEKNTFGEEHIYNKLIGDGHESRKKYLAFEEDKLFCLTCIFGKNKNKSALTTTGLKLSTYAPTNHAITCHEKSQQHQKLFEKFFGTDVNGDTDRPEDSGTAASDSAPMFNELPAADDSNSRFGFRLTAEQNSRVHDRLHDICNDDEGEEELQKMTFKTDDLSTNRNVATFVIKLVIFMVTHGN